MITGSAPDRLTFTWKHADDIDSPMSGPTWDWVAVDTDPEPERN